MRFEFRAEIMQKLSFETVKIRYAVAKVGGVALL